MQTELTSTKKKPEKQTDNIKAEVSQVKLRIDSLEKKNRFKKKN